MMQLSSNKRDISVSALSLTNKLILPKSIHVLEKNKRYFKLSTFATGPEEPKYLQTFYIDPQDSQPYTEPTI